MLGTVSAGVKAWGAQVGCIHPAAAELLGPAKMMGCEDKKQTSGTHKPAHRHLRAPRAPLQALASLGLSRHSAELGIWNQPCTARCFIRTNTIFDVLLQTIQSHTVLEVAFLHKTHKTRDLQGAGSRLVPDVH